MDVGFTGTRHGMNYRQATQVRNLLTHHFAIGARFHHGGCVGADVEAAEVAKELGYFVIRHPGPDPDGEWEDDEFRGDDEWRDRKTHFARNRDIVNESSVLIATPVDSPPPTKRTGGTWYTVTYALRSLKPVAVHIVLPE